MTIGEWAGLSLGEGPIVVLADWDDGTPADREMALYASAAPSHQPVRVSFPALGTFLAAHAGALFLSRDVAAVVAPLLGQQQDPGRPPVAQLVAGRVAAGFWVDVHRLLDRVTDQHLRLTELLDDEALLALDDLLCSGGTGGLEQFSVLVECCRNGFTRLARSAADRPTGHQLLAALYAELREFAAVLFEEALASTRESGDVIEDGPAAEESVPDRDTSYRPRPIPLDGSLAGVEGLVACAGWELLGNRIDVWAGLVGRHLERTALIADRRQAAAFHGQMLSGYAQYWETARRHQGLTECFEPPDWDRGRSPSPVLEKVSAWVGEQAKGLADDDHLAPVLPPVREPPSIERWGFWAAASPALSACRELLRYHGVSSLLGQGADRPAGGARAADLSVYRRVARRLKCEAFAPRTGHEFWVVKPRELALRSLSAVLGLRGYHAGFMSRLPHDLLDYTRPRFDYPGLRHRHDPLPPFDAYALIAAELEAGASERGRNSRDPEEQTREFLLRLSAADDDAERWVRTARALTETATFGVPTSYLASVFLADYGLDWSEPKIRQLRTILAGSVLPELTGYWEDGRVYLAADRLGLPDAQVLGPPLLRALSVRTRGHPRVGNSRHPRPPDDEGRGARRPRAGGQGSRTGRPTGRVGRRGAHAGHPAVPARHPHADAGRAGRGSGVLVGGAPPRVLHDLRRGAVGDGARTIGGRVPDRRRHPGRGVDRGTDRAVGPEYDPRERGARVPPRPGTAGLPGGGSEGPYVVTDTLISTGVIHAGGVTLRARPRPGRRRTCAEGTRCPPRTTGSSWTGPGTGVPQTSSQRLPMPAPRRVTSFATTRAGRRRLDGCRARGCVRRLKHEGPNCVLCRKP
jgi:hypothetical protein